MTTRTGLIRRRIYSSKDRDCHVPIASGLAMTMEIKSRLISPSAWFDRAHHKGSGQALSAGIPREEIEGDRKEAGLPILYQVRDK